MAWPARPKPPSRPISAHPRNGRPAPPARSAAIAERFAFARLLADVKAGVTQAPTTTLGSADLKALEAFIIEPAHLRLSARRLRVAIGT